MTDLASTDGRALGTAMRVVVSEPSLLAPAVAAVEQIVRDIDLACSRFREDSELSRLHAERGRETAVSPLLLTALEAALRGARATDGAVDPTVGTAVKRVGYVGDFATVEPDGAPLRLAVEAVPGWQCLRVSRVSRSVLIPPGVEVDLGATAKALASDLAAAAALRAMGRGGVLVSLGGDIAVAGAAPDGGWRITVAEDSDPNAAGGEEVVTVQSGGLGTSSTTVRRWRRGSVELHHIIDPATGLPAAGRWRTVTVAAADCLDANIAATAAIVRGDAAVAWLEALGLPARLVATDGAVTRTSHWPAPAGVAAG